MSQPIPCCHLDNGVQCEAPSEWMMRWEGQHPSDADVESCTEHLSDLVADTTIEIHRRVPAGG